MSYRTIVADPPWDYSTGFPPSQWKGRRWHAPLPYALGIGWMSRAELSEAIPPAYTAWVGQHLLTHIAQTKPDLAAAGAGT